VTNLCCREEHEDALLHENLLCLKALCTTELAMQYLKKIHKTLFPALLHMLFDPEKKGPNEFNTRAIITSILLRYIESGDDLLRSHRAQTVAHFLRDPSKREEERPVDFILDMQQDRPYRMWCKELVNVTKEVFWIFLHNHNVVYLGAESKFSEPDKEAVDKGFSQTGSANHELKTYMHTHFPKGRPPVPAAPYVGGVEWDATNYLASHLDLMNAILASLPAREYRNTLREHFRMSGFEKCMGASLRTCKEKFYGAVHDGLRVWVAAAVEDDWDVQTVRFGPVIEKPMVCLNGKWVSRVDGKKDPAPKLELNL
jgi:hypothetical protein